MGMQIWLSICMYKFISLIPKWEYVQTPKLYAVPKSVQLWTDISPSPTCRRDTCRFPHNSLILPFLSYEEEVKEDTNVL